MNEKVSLTQPWVGCFIDFFTGWKPNYYMSSGVYNIPY